VQKSGRVHPKSNTPCRDDRRQAFHFGQNLFSKSFQRCCRVDPLQRSRASARYRQTARVGWRGFASVENPQHVGYEED
jgi:hypothetical protein